MKLKIVKISKKDREKQRHSFKEVLHTFETGESPTEELTVSGNKFVFSNWTYIKRLQVFRNILGSGFLLHLKYNILISRPLNINIETVDKTTAKNEKKLEEIIVQSKKKNAPKNANKDALPKSN